MTVGELKYLAFEVFSVPVEDQRLLITGLALLSNYDFYTYSTFYTKNLTPPPVSYDWFLKLYLDGKTIADYPQIKDDSKLKLVPMQKPLTLEELVTGHLQDHYSTEDTAKIVKEFMKGMQNTLTNYSLDDYEKMATSLLN